MSNGWVKVLMLCLAKWTRALSSCGDSYGVHKCGECVCACMGDGVFVCGECVYLCVCVPASTACGITCTLQDLKKKGGHAQDGRHVWWAGSTSTHVCATITNSCTHIMHYAVPPCRRMQTSTHTHTHNHTYAHAHTHTHTRTYTRIHVEHSHKYTRNT